MSDLPAGGVCSAFDLAAKADDGLAAQAAQRLLIGQLPGPELARAEIGRSDYPRPGTPAAAFSSKKVIHADR